MPSLLPAVRNIHNLPGPPQVRFQAAVRPLLCLYCFSALKDNFQVYTILRKVIGLGKNIHDFDFQELPVSKRYHHLSGKLLKFGWTFFLRKWQKSGEWIKLP